MGVDSQFFLGALLEETFKTRKLKNLRQ